MQTENGIISSNNWGVMMQWWGIFSVWEPHVLWLCGVNLRIQFRHCPGPRWLLGSLRMSPHLKHLGRQIHSFQVLNPQVFEKRTHQASSWVKIAKLFWCVHHGATNHGYFMQLYIHVICVYIRTWYIRAHMCIHGIYPVTCNNGKYREGMNEQFLAKTVYKKNIWRDLIMWYTHVHPMP